jgi:hypothetical protein
MRKTAMYGWKRMMAGFLAAAMIVAAALESVYASSNEDSFQVTGESYSAINVAANVTDSDIAALGYSVIISIPLEITLSRDGATYKGSGRIYAYGIMNSDTTLTVNLDKEDEEYGVVYFNPGNGADSYTYEREAHDINLVTETLSKTSFSPSETLANEFSMEDKTEIAHYSTASVQIASFVPFGGAGEYTTCVPLIIDLVTAETK